MYAFRSVYIMVYFGKYDKCKLLKIDERLVTLVVFVCLTAYCDAFI